ncbi:hypothetical protein P0082_07255 [Candidatus Haliotispira prima]|uniref:Uncharacterized protein n=1 Tax=Candidatus Haliotispira prima TaxID=3034016 RepID=A0ABY8ME81_9SPIO|nr:hypothetical protein P0082_07255 [Candidatus Haliotispira prima]
MNIVKLTNKIAIFMLIAMIYWVFIFICINVFGFRIFRENITQLFSLGIIIPSIILIGSIILNIMLNLTAIAEGKGGIKIKTSTVVRFAVVFSISLVVLFSLLYLGDVTSTRKKEDYLIAAATKLAKEQSAIISRLSKYSFSLSYLESAIQDIKILGQVEEQFPSITVIVRDSIQGSPYLFGFPDYLYRADKDIQKTDYILSTSAEEREYLHSVFDGKEKQYRFSSNDGNYEIYYPVKGDGGTIVLHLSQYNRYGKVGP